MVIAVIDIIAKIIGEKTYTNDSISGETRTIESDGAFKNISNNDNPILDDIPKHHSENGKVVLTEGTDTLLHSGKTDRDKAKKLGADPATACTGGRGHGLDGKTHLDDLVSLHTKGVKVVGSKAGAHPPL